MNAQGVRGEQLLSGGERFAVQPGLVSRLIAPGFRTIIDRIDRGLEKGSMLAHLPDGTSRMLGGRNPGFEAELTLHDWRALIRLATSGSVGWYQAYEAGEWSAADMVTLFAVMGDNVRTLGNAARSSGPFKWLARLAHWLNRNNRAGSARNISAHYDLGNDFYAAWLDPSMAYSSGFAWGEDGLEGAQKRKFDAISRRLGPAKTVLEIGCGWGGLARHIASTGASTGAEVTAISLSDQQLAFARADNPAHITFRKQDYRDVEGAYDGIASVASHAKFATKRELSVPLLSDEHGHVCEDYGVWKEKNMYGKTYMGIERTTYLIDANGHVAMGWAKVKVPGHAEAVLAAVQAL